MIRLQILGITFSQVQAGAYALILAEENGNRRVPIIVGTPEAQSIAIFLEGLNPPRPLTHDLFISFVKLLNIQVKQVNIYKYEDGIFYSELIFEDNGRIIHLDSRTSDAIALALRMDAPIFIANEIMDQVSILMAEDDLFEDAAPVEKKVVSLETMTLKELQNALNEAIAMENYEKASAIRDIINKNK
jgi:bifunctional DNase/RNase